MPPTLPGGLDDFVTLVLPSYGAGGSSGRNTRDRPCEITSACPVPGTRIPSAALSPAERGARVKTNLRKLSAGGRQETGL